ncbi:hypothetical protein D3C75_1048980 [compost metagenome]
MSAQHVELLAVLSFADDHDLRQALYFRVATDFAEDVVQALGVGVLLHYFAQGCQTQFVAVQRILGQQFQATVHFFAVVGGDDQVAEQ